MARLLRSRVVFCSLANAKCCTIGLDATNCLKPLRASCDRSIAKEKSERCPVETALVKVHLEVLAGRQALPFWLNMLRPDVITREGTK